LDLVSLLYGGEIVSVSDAHYGPPHNLLLPTRGVNMKDGWETKRRRGPGHDWAIIRMACSGIIRRAIVDTSHFKGNYPESCSIETCSVTSEADLLNDNVWKPLLERTRLRAHFEHLYTEDDLLHQEPATHVRLKSFPDGGISRLRLFGELSVEGRMEIGLRRLNAMWPTEAHKVFLSICQSRHWAESMVQARPFVSVEALQEQALEHWNVLQSSDWLEAFAGHPRIGQKKAATDQSAQSHQWSKQEQASMDTAADTVQEELAAANERYFEKFGYIFIVCATGKSPQEMLDILNSRLPNDADTELPIAAGQQAEITALRLEKWLKQ
jgi:allantoicase